MTLSIDSYLAYLKMSNIFLITAQVPKGSIYNRHKDSFKELGPTVVTIITITYSYSHILSY